MNSFRSGDGGFTTSIELSGLLCRDNISTFLIERKILDGNQGP